MNDVVSNGFRRKEKAPLSRKQLTSVMDETAPAVIQHAGLIKNLQRVVAAHELLINGLEDWHRATFLQRLKWLFRGNPS